MKSYKNLYCQIYPFANLYEAYRLARKGKRGKAAAANFEINLEPNLLALERELKIQTYQPGPHTHFTIHEPKARLISAAPFRDRVVHHALYRVIEPIWEARFIGTNYACRVGKGTHPALNKAHAWVKQYRYAFQGDIVKYFPSIDHQILRGHLARHIADPQVLWLIDQIMASGTDIPHQDIPSVFLPGDTLFAALRPRGLPIGNLTSQLWANIYLHHLDLFVKQTLRCRAYLRYMDDFVLFSDDKAQLHTWHQAIRYFLKTELRVILHDKKSLVFPTQIGLDFCGFRLYHTHRRLRRSSLRRFVRRMRRQQRAYQQGDLSLADWRTSLQSWIAHSAHGNTWRLRKRLFADYPIKPVR